MKNLYLLLISTVLLIIVNSNPIAENDEEDHSHPFGRPISLMRFDENENVIIDVESLDNTFNHPEVKDRKIAAISIIGAFRKGKSFLMDYALRYMYANYKSVAYRDNPLSNKRDWIGDPESPLKGFTWRGGTSRDTTGVVLWSDVFLHDYKDEKTGKTEKLAIILMDTQGLFDTKTSPTDNSRIFALGTLISSIQIFNLNDVIQENQLEYLQMATDFAKFAMKKNRAKDKRAKNYKPFQNLIFLMRDWQNDEDYPYGLSGGAQYLAHVLSIETSQPPVLQDVRRYITESFEQRLCFLLPHPGFSAVNNKQYDGRFSELSEDFQLQLKDFLNWLLMPRNLKKKKVLNAEVNGIEYLEYMKAYFEAFQSDDIPRIETLHGITVKKQYDIVILEAFTEYKNLLQTIQFKKDNEWKELNAIDEEINQIHRNALEVAIKIFADKKKLGNEADERKFEAEMKNQIETYFNEWKVKQIESYQNIKAIEDRNKAEREELNRQKEEELRQEKEKADRERSLLEEEHKNKTIALEGTIAEVKNKTAQEIELITREFNNTKEEAERQRLLMLKQLEDEKRLIELKAKETQDEFQRQLLLMQEEIKKKEEAAKKQIEDKQAERLEALKLQTEERKMQFERDMKIAEKREQAMAENRKYERERMAEERRIREETAREERREREKAEREQREADRLFQQQQIDIRREEQRERKEAQERKDREFQQMMLTMQQKQTEVSEIVTLGKVIGCVVTIFMSCL